MRRIIMVVVGPT
jgi:hypothetical protein